MRVLIDTHTLIWYISNALNLSQKAKDIIASDETAVAISIASIWEISIKISLGRLEIDGGFHRLPAVLERYEIQILPIVFDHTFRQISLPFHHKDPFDRMIAAAGFG